MSYYVVDIEADGPVPGLYSMVCFGAVKVDRQLQTTFYGTTKPITPAYLPNALEVSGFTRQQHDGFDDPEQTMRNFDSWVRRTSVGYPIFFSDNNGFDWAFINYYCHRYLGQNPFGFSSRRISDLFCGFHRDMRYRWKHLRKTKHTHNPVDDAMGDAEAMLALCDAGLPMDLS